MKTDNFQTVKKRADELIAEFKSVPYDELEAARAVATAAHETYSPFDEAEWKRFKENGIWNDDVAVQAALAMLRLCKEGKL